ncbi:helix-turn-helix transcriptional regulator [Actinocorallia lasiicapitis]
MTARDETRREIARRVTYWMARRGMTRQIFADRLGKSVSWVDKIHTGDRQLDRLSVLEQIADVLGISLATLIDRRTAARAADCADEVEIAALREALQRYDGLLGRIHEQPPDLPRLRRDVDYGWTSFQASNYQVSTRLLPDLLVTLQHAYRTLNDHDREQAAELLVQAYWLAAGIAMKFGQPELSWVAADRGMTLAEWSGDPALIGGTARRVVHAMLGAPEPAGARHAINLVRTVADRLEPGLGNATPAYRSNYGMLLLKGSIAAGQIGDAVLARDLNAEAGVVAGLLGGDRNDHWSAFGPTNVGVHRVSALADLHEGGRVVEFARGLAPDQLATLPRERRANHTVDVARGYAQAGKRDDAVRLVLDADTLAREEVRCRPLARSLVAQLAGSYPRGRRPSTAFSTLAREMGIAV